MCIPGKSPAPRSRALLREYPPQECHADTKYSSDHYSHSLASSASSVFREMPLVQSWSFPYRPARPQVRPQRSAPCRQLHQEPQSSQNQIECLHDVSEYHNKLNRLDVVNFLSSRSVSSKCLAPLARFVELEWRSPSISYYSRPSKT
jgi:hypothetical protein